MLKGLLDISSKLSATDVDLDDGAEEVGFCDISLETIESNAIEEIAKSVGSIKDYFIFEDRINSLAISAADFGHEEGYKKRFPGCFKASGGTGFINLEIRSKARKTNV